MRETSPSFQMVPPNVSSTLQFPQCWESVFKHKFNLVDCFLQYVQIALV